MGVFFLVLVNLNCYCVLVFCDLFSCKCGKYSYVKLWSHFVCIIGKLNKLFTFYLSLVVLEYVEHRAHAAKFGQLIDKVYKEMMTMGFIGFIIFITFNAFSLEHDENYLAFEFAHITIFFMAIVAVFRALFVIYVCVQ